MPNIFSSTRDKHASRSPEISKAKALFSLKAWANSRIPKLPDQHRPGISPTPHHLWAEQRPQPQPQPQSARPHPQRRNTAAGLEFYKYDVNIGQRRDQHNFHHASGPTVRRRNSAMPWI